MVKKTLNGFKRTSLEQGIDIAPVQKAPLMVKHLREMLETLPDSLRGTRDRAVILLGYAAALRRSDLAALRVSDVSFKDDHMRVRIRRSKTGPTVDRVAATRLTKARGELVDIRNSVEHMEEMLIDGQLEEGVAVAIVLHDGQIELAGHTARFDDLARWVEALHALAVEWSDYREP